MSTFTDNCTCYPSSKKPFLNANREPQQDTKQRSTGHGNPQWMYLYHIPYVFMALEHERRGTGIILRARIPGSLLKGAAQTRTEQWQYQLTY